MKPVHQLERELADARQAGIDLHTRGEQWRQTLEEIRKINQCPIISSIIKRSLNT